jgi:hypothetical protein
LNVALVAVTAVGAPVDGAGTVVKDSTTPAPEDVAFTATTR